jgi:molybdopterin synthase sulfur carrier subunit
MTVVVHYYAGARAAAGLDDESVELPPGSTVASLADDLADRHGPALARVLASCTFLVDAVAGGHERTLDGAREVDVLPPFAGGF